ncbi:hypothetical protein [Candidatus Ruthia endofausta]|nr:hypothetical protein [Candidatus Ruthia endofausta]
MQWVARLFMAIAVFGWPQEKLPVEVKDDKLLIAVEVCHAVGMGSSRWA